MPNPFYMLASLSEVRNLACHAKTAPRASLCSSRHPTLLIQSFYVRSSLLKRYTSPYHSSPTSTTKSNQLLRSPNFHRMVGVIHKKVHQLRTGEKIERGGTSIEGMTPQKLDAEVKPLMLQQIRIRPKRYSHISQPKSRTNFEI